MVVVTEHMGKRCKETEVCREPFIVEEMSWCEEVNRRIEAAGGQEEDARNPALGSEQATTVDSPDISWIRLGHATLSSIHRDFVEWC